MTDLSIINKLYWGALFLRSYYVEFILFFWKFQCIKTQLYSLWFSLGMICLDQELFLRPFLAFVYVINVKLSYLWTFLLKGELSFFYTAAVNGEIFRCHLFRRPNLYLTVNTTHYTGQPHKCYVRLHLKRLLFLSDFRKSWNGWAHFFKILQVWNFTKVIRSQSRSSMRTDGLMAKLIFAFRNCFVKAAVIFS
jgi:hypothetical protein